MILFRKVKETST